VVGGRGVAVCRSMKRAYQSAVQNAFSRLLLVVLDNGKVFADVNTTLIDNGCHTPGTDAATAAAAPYHAEILPVYNIHPLVRPKKIVVSGNMAKK